MPFDPSFALHTLLPLLEAAYVVPAIAPPFEVVATIEPGHFGYIARSADTLVLAFRGTETAGEWLEDLDALVGPNAYGSGWAHIGFQRAYEGIRQSVIDSVKSISDPLPLLIVGHSLGAALAMLAAGDLARSGWKVTVYTCAGPRVGLHDFAHWLESLVSQIYRIDNTWDIVPHVPSCIHGFEHAGVGISINSGYADAKTAHRLETGYRPGLERLVASSKPVPMLKIA